MNVIRFDESLPLMVGVIEEVLGRQAVECGLALRDTSGRLAFFVDHILSAEQLSLILDRLQLLGPYLRTDRAVAGIEDYGVRELFEESALTVNVGELKVRLLDRRLVGADWLRTPARLAPPPPRFVFASLKGGVGRTTALSVAAAHLASQGKRVLAIDMDMEAPGLGAILLDSGTTPEFGLIDALVEVKLGELDDTFMADLVGPSALADRNGRIDVLPAFGTRSIAHPGEVLAKIARAYAEHVQPDGTVLTILDQVRAVVDYFSSSGRYDVVLVDARAGLHETTASAILGLGAHVFLFGLNEPQTFQGYAALLSHLNRVKPRDVPSGEWLDWLTMVQGKAPADENARTSFDENCTNMFVAVGLIDKPASITASVQLPAGPFNDVPWDDTITDAEVAIEDETKEVDTAYVLDDERFRLFDPKSRIDLLALPTYSEVYKAFLARIEVVLTNEGEIAN